jgi:type I restriction enzyme M protein
VFEQTFKNIDTILRNDGLESEIAYIEQTSWLLFLKYLDDLERDRSTEAALQQKSYTRIIEEKYRWSSWAVPRGKDGKIL